MDDREVVAKIAAGDPAGIAEAYDGYAAGLYGYCHWMLHQPADAAEALTDSFVIAATTVGDLPEGSKLRPWLYGVARKECQRRLRTTPAGADRTGVADQATDEGQQASAPPQPIDATQPFRTIRQSFTAADQPIDATQPFRATYEQTSASSQLTETDLPTLVRAILAELAPGDREVIELNLRHDLYDADLAIALGVPWSQAHALALRARGHLENALGPFLIPRTGQEVCPVLAELLIGWDVQPTNAARDLIGAHIEMCEVCASRSRSSLRPTVLSALLPMAALPPGLREQILEPSSDTPPDTVADRRQPVRGTKPPRPARFSRAISLVGWHNPRDNPGWATAVAVIVLWAVAAVSVTVLTFASSHPARALAVRPSPSTAASSPAADPATIARAPATSAPSASAQPSPTISQPPAVVTPAIQPSALPASTTASPSPSAKPSSSASAKPSSSASAKPSSSPSTKPSSSPSSPSPTASRSSSAA